MNQTVLLIEDNDQNRYLATFLLERHGYMVVATPDGPTGIATAGARPALILLDIQLPGMDGYAVARALRAEAALAGTPIVAVTLRDGRGSRASARRGLRRLHREAHRSGDVRCRAGALPAGSPEGPS